MSHKPGIQFMFISIADIEVLLNYSSYLRQRQGNHLMQLVKWQK